MKYYKEAGVNPLASCLPLLLQIPVFISLVYMLRTDLKKHICGAALKVAGDTTSTQIGKADCNKLTHSHVASFLFINDITSKAAGLVLIVLMVALRRHDDLHQRDDVGRQRSQPAPDLDRPAGLLRHLRDPVPGGSAGLLDRDELHDDPPAVLHAPPLRTA